MKDDIVDKLKTVIANGNEDEQAVVYFLVQSYKLIEQANKLKDFELIKFYRNWVCHSSLSEDSQKIFEEVYIIIRAEKYLNLEERGKNEMPAFAELIDDTISEAFEKYSFKNLKKEIEKFSEVFLGGHMPNWENLNKNIYEVLINIPLIIRKNREEVFRFELIEISGKGPLDGMKIRASFPGGWLQTGARDEFFEL